jgi:hypothetical protein
MGYASGSAFQTLGRGIRDIGAIAGLSRREREEQKRREEQEQYARDQDRLNTDLSIADRGGSREQPMVERTLPQPMQPGQRPPSMSGGPLLDEPRGLGVEAPTDFMPTPDFQPTPQVTLSEPDSDFQEVGAGESRAFVPTQDSIRAREEARSTQELEQEAQDYTSVMRGDYEDDWERLGVIAARRGPGILNLRPGQEEPEEVFDPTKDPALLRRAAIEEDPEKYGASGGAETGPFDPETDRVLARERERVANPELYSTPDDDEDGRPNRPAAVYTETLRMVKQDEKYMTDGEEISQSRALEITDAIINGEPTEQYEVSPFWETEGLDPESDQAQYENRPWDEGKRWWKPGTWGEPGPTWDDAGAQVGPNARLLDDDDDGGTLIRDTVAVGSPPPEPPPAGQPAPPIPVDVRPPVTDSTPRILVGPGADNVPPPGTSTANMPMAPQETLDEAWESYSMVPAAVRWQTISGHDWTADEMEYFREQEAEDEAGEPGPPNPEGMGTFDLFEGNPFGDFTRGRESLQQPQTPTFPLPR